MTILDRYILRAILVNYVIALSVMLGLYVVLDLLINMDEFTEQAVPGTVLAGIVSYYGYNLFLYFAQLSGVITLFACLAALVRMRRGNEMTAILASGVSLYRVAAPILGFGLLAGGLWLVDTELIIPAVAPKLARRHDDALGRQSYGVWFLRDRENALLSAQKFDPTTQTLRRLLVTFREASGVVTHVLQAEQARWQPAADRAAGGYWELEGGLRRTLVAADEPRLGPSDGVHEEPVRVYHSDLDPAAIQLRQSSQWVRFLSWAGLGRLSEKGELEVARVQQIKHSRFSTPIVNLILLLLGLPFLLGPTPGNILNDGARCLGVCGLCFLTAFAGQNLSMEGPLSALPSWLPIFLFTPTAVVLFDRIRT